jgi:predicted RNase H-like HicB family nuclease
VHEHCVLRENVREVDIASQGRTETEALANLQEALELHLETSGEEPHVLVKVA